MYREVEKEKSKESEKEREKKEAANKVKIERIYLPNPSATGRMWHKVNF